MHPNLGWPAWPVPWGCRQANHAPLAATWRGAKRPSTAPCSGKSEALDVTGGAAAAVYSRASSGHHSGSNPRSAEPICSRWFAIPTRLHVLPLPPRRHVPLFLSPRPVTFSSRSSGFRPLLTSHQTMQPKGFPKPSGVVCKRHFQRQRRHP